MAEMSGLRSQYANMPICRAYKIRARDQPMEATIKRRDFGRWEELSAAVLGGRVKARISCQHLADRAGVPVELLESLELGGRTDDRAGLVRILEELGIDARTLPIPDEDRAGERARQ